MGLDDFYDFFLILGFVILNYQLVQYRLFVAENQRKERKCIEGRLDRKDYEVDGFELILEGWLRIRFVKRMFFYIVYIFE